MIKIVRGAGAPELKSILSRGDVRFDQEEKAVRAVISRIRKEGDKALFAFTKRFDGVTLSPASLRIGKTEIRARAKKCDHALRKAIDAAIANIRQYHSRQEAPDFAFSPSRGVLLNQRTLPVDSAAIYVPGGFHPLFSTVLMTVIPAQVAGVRRIAIATPPRKGGLDPAMAYCFLKLNLTEIYRMGGAQAVAAFAIGTKSVPKVDKIVGPGNNYVSLAKKLLYGIIDIDMIAGPSEILVIADGSARPAFIARDLLSQSEHGSGSESSVLLTTDAKLAKAVQAEVASLIKNEPAKSSICRALSSYGLIMVLKNLDECVKVANRIAPEHIEIMTRNPRQVLKGVRNAGAAFLGSYTCEPVGDYFAGPSHVLPTNGTARFFSPLSVYHFLKRMSVMEYDRPALKHAGDKIIRMADKEGLSYHAEAVKIRVK